MVSPGPVGAKHSIRHNTSRPGYSPEESFHRKSATDYIAIPRGLPIFKNGSLTASVMPKEKEITIYDIAERLHLSVATVSRALKDDAVVSRKTRKRVMDQALLMGYRSNHFARNLRTQRTNTIGVIVPRLNSHFMSAVIAGIESVAGSQGYHLLISQSSESAARERASAKTFYDNRVDGLLVSLAYDTTDTSYFDLFVKKEIPLIFFDRVPTDRKMTSVLIDNRKAACEATKHLADQGCKRIVHITAASALNVYADRLAGYKQALAEKGLKFRPDYVITTNLSQESGADAAAQMLQLTPRPDAAFVANDNCAVGCMMALKKAGYKIPEDFAFIGFNNDPVTTVIEPNLSTVNYPGYLMGETAAINLVHHLNKVIDIGSMTAVLLHTELIIRESSLKTKHTD
jgi:LacI family transcriptional regulator